MSDDCVLNLDDGVVVVVPHHTRAARERGPSRRIAVVPLRIPRVTETREGLDLALANVGEDGSESR